MKNQVWCKTNIGYFATRDKIRKDSSISSWDEHLGRFTFDLKGCKDFKIQITSKQNKLGITYPEQEGYELILKKVKPLLLQANGSPAEIFEIKELLPKSREIFLKQRVGEKIKDLQFLLMRNPTILEIAHAVNETPETIRETVFNLSSISNWREPSEKECSDAKKKLKEIYELGSILQRFGNSGTPITPLPLIRESPNIIVQWVEYALKNKKDELPEIVVLSEDEKRIEFEFRWPRNSEWYLSHDYSQFYYKETRRISVKMAPQAERVNEEFQKLLKEMKDSKKH